MNDQDELPPSFRKLGQHHVRLMIETRTMPPQFHPAALRWLAGHAQKKESSERSFRS